MKLHFDTSKSVVEKLNYTLFNEHDVEVFVKRDDLIDNYISGNKWRKLKYNIDLCFSKKNDTILTFGGAFSNHIVATAKACQLAGLNSIGIIRGEELNENSNDTLKKCKEFGMQLIFVSRDEYRMRNEKSYIEELHQEHPNVFIVPEGGANYYGAIGCQEILRECKSDYDKIAVAGGTGTTAAGVALSLKDHQSLIYVNALKGNFVEDDLRKILYLTCFDHEIVDDILKKIEIIDDKRFGGYHKYNDELIDFIKAFYRETKLKLDLTYTAKAMLEVIQQIKEGRIQPGQKVLFIHTGGLQAMKKFDLFEN